MAVEKIENSDGYDFSNTAVRKFNTRGFQAVRWPG